MSEPNLNQIQDEDSDLNEEYSTPLQVYRRLLIVVNNELSSPDLLPYEQLIVDCILEQIEHMKETLNKFKSSLDKFCSEQHQMELERLTFIVKKYYRARIEKVERNSQSLVNMIKKNKRLAFKIMSTQEIKYLDNYINSIDHNLASVCSTMPKNMQSFHLLDIKPDERFNDNRYVFIKGLKDTSVLVEDPQFGQEVIEIPTGSQHFLPFSAVKSNLVTGSKDILIL